jgi:hypothetical protein
MGQNSAMVCLVLRGYKLSEPLEEGDFGRFACSARQNRFLMGH